MRSNQTELVQFVPQSSGELQRKGVEFAPPASYPPMSIACVATHDLATLAGWIRPFSSPPVSVESAAQNNSSGEGGFGIQGRRARAYALSG